MSSFANSVSPVRRSHQRGSALLVVLVLAAIIAIMLYKELPIAAFEAQRQREQLTVSRGNEYKRAVKLFVRKIGRFPSSLQELESTNRMRFLRHKYVDPLTGKDDWRLIHAGPGGIIIDSKVASASKTGANALGQPAVFAGFNNTFTGDQTALTDAASSNAALRQRAPATKNAATAAGDSSSLPQFAADTANTEANGTPGSGPGQPGIFNQNPPFDPATGQVTGQPSNLPGGQGTAPADPNAPGGNGIGSVAQQLNNVNPKMPEQAGAGQTPPAFGNNQPGQAGVAGQSGGIPLQPGTGQIGGAGGIAGVASIAKGKSIKTVEDQTKYNLWEFYYDLRKDQANGAAGMPQGVNNGQNTTNGVNNANGNTSSAFGSNSSSAFGSNNANSSSFGNSGNSQNNTGGFGQSNSGQTTTGGFGQTGSNPGFNPLTNQQQQTPQTQQPPPQQ